MFTVERNDICFLCTAEKKQATMSMDSIVTVNLLQIIKKSFTIKLKVLHVGFQQNYGKNFSIKRQKMIIIDKEVIVKHFNFNISITYLAAWRLV